ncbi:MAG: transcriptional regulator [Acidobacteriota bacterium]
MAAVVDKNKYGKLLAKTLPKKIETEEEYECFLVAVDRLFDLGDKMSPEEEAIFDLLTLLIEEYEEREYPIENSSPLQVLQHLMEERDLKSSDLWSIIGSKGYTSDILNGKRVISKAIAKKLANYFHVSPELFLYSE